MIAHINEPRSERRRGLAEQMYRFRDEPIKTMRKAAVSSADGIKSLKAPVRAFAHSGVKLATVSQNDVQNLVELESEVIMSAMTGRDLRDVARHTYEVFIKATRKTTTRARKSAA